MLFAVIGFSSREKKYHNIILINTEVKKKYLTLLRILSDIGLRIPPDKQITFCEWRQEGDSWILERHSRQLGDAWCLIWENNLRRWDTGSWRRSKKVLNCSDNLSLTMNLKTYVVGKGEWLMWWENLMQCWLWPIVEGETNLPHHLLTLPTFPTHTPSTRPVPFYSSNLMVSSTICKNYFPFSTRKIFLWYAYKDSN